MKLFFTFLFLILLTDCAQSSHSYTKVSRGSEQKFEAVLDSFKGKGPIKFRKIKAADWVADREGLIDIEDPKAKEAGLKEGKEPIEIYFYAIDHPLFGKYIIDTGISKEFRKSSDEWPVSSLIKKFMNLKELIIHETIDEWISKNKITLDGVFLTHMHLDHILGTPDMPPNTTVFVGPRESRYRGFLNLFVQGSTDRLVGKNVKIEELEFGNENPEEIQAIDFFGDKSLIVFWVSGHTPGSLAFLLQTTAGPELILGDTCHTAWGWENNVSPGGYTANPDFNRKKLTALKNLSIKIPGIKVHPGHQSLK